MHIGAQAQVFEESFDGQAAEHSVCRLQKGGWMPCCKKSLTKRAQTKM